MHVLEPRLARTHRRLVRRIAVFALMGAAVTAAVILGTGLGQEARAASMPETTVTVCKDLFENSPMLPDGVSPSDFDFRIDDGDPQTPTVSSAPMTQCGSTDSAPAVTTFTVPTGSAFTISETNNTGYSFDLVEVFGCVTSVGGPDVDLDAGTVSIAAGYTDTEIQCTLGNELQDALVCVIKIMSADAVDAGFGIEDVTIEADTPGGGPSDSLTLAESPVSPCTPLITPTGTAVGYAQFFLAPDSVRHMSEDAAGLELEIGLCEQSGSNNQFANEQGIIEIDRRANANFASNATIVCSFRNDLSDVSVCVVKYVTDTAFDAGAEADHFTMSLTADDVAVDPIGPSTADPSAACDPCSLVPSELPFCAPCETQTLLDTLCVGGNFSAAGIPADAAQLAFTEFVVPAGAQVTATETIPNAALVGSVFSECAQLGSIFGPLTNGASIAAPPVEPVTASGTAVGDNGPLHCLFVNDSIRVCVQKYVTPDARDAGVAVRGTPYMPGDFSFEITLQEPTTTSAGFASLAAVDGPAVGEVTAVPSTECASPDCDDGQGAGRDCFAQGPGYGYAELFVAPNSDFIVSEVIPDGAPIAAINPDCTTAARVLTDDGQDDNGDMNPNSASGTSPSQSADTDPIRCTFVNDSERVCVQKTVLPNAFYAGFDADLFSFEVDYGDSAEPGAVGTAPSQVQRSPSGGCEERCGYDDGGTSGLSAVSNDGCEPCTELNAATTGAGDPCPQEISHGGEWEDGEWDWDPSQRFGPVGYTEFFVTPGSYFSITETGPQEAPIGPVASDCEEGGDKPKPVDAGNGPYDHRDFAMVSHTSDSYIDVSKIPNLIDEPVRCYFDNDSIIVCVAKIVGPNGVEAGFMPGDFGFGLQVGEPAGENVEAVVFASANLEAEGGQPKIGPVESLGCRLDRCDAYDNGGVGSVDVSDDCPQECDEYSNDSRSANLAAGCAELLADERLGLAGFTQFLVAPGDYVTVSETIPDAGTEAHPDARIGAVRSECTQFAKDWVVPGGVQNGPAVVEDPYETPETASARARAINGPMFCEFINDSVKVVVNKELEIDSGGTALVNEFGFDIFDSNGELLATGHDPSDDTSDDMFVAYLAPNQDVTIGEFGPAGYEQNFGRCSFGDPRANVFAGDGGFIEFALPMPEYEVACIFVNEDLPLIPVCVSQILDPLLTDFELGDVGVEIYQDGSLQGTVFGSLSASEACVVESANLVAAGSANANVSGSPQLVGAILPNGNSFTLVQIFPANSGVRLASVGPITCSPIGAAMVPQSIAGASNTFSPPAGTTAVNCTANAAAVPVPVDIAVIVNGGANVPADFTVTLVDGESNEIIVGPGGQSLADLAPGTYTVTQTSLASYTTTVDGCNGGGATFTVDNLTTAVSCSFTNNTNLTFGAIPVNPGITATDQELLDASVAARAVAVPTIPVSTNVISLSELAVTGGSSTSAASIGVAMIAMGALIGGAGRSRRRTRS